MKIRNKKTGNVYTLIDHIFDNYKSLAEFNAEWEDYQPLIKDEKIRDIIRLWTKVNDVVGLTYNASENSLTDIFRNEIDFNEMLGLEDGGFYSTKELCGEEEE